MDVRYPYAISVMSVCRDIIFFFCPHSSNLPASVNSGPGADITARKDRPRLKEGDSPAAHSERMTFSCHRFHLTVLSGDTHHCALLRCEINQPSVLTRSCEGLFADNILRYFLSLQLSDVGAAACKSLELGDFKSHSSRADAPSWLRDKCNDYNKVCIWGAILQVIANQVILSLVLTVIKE